MVQSMGGITLPNTYGISIRVDNYPIQDDKIGLRPPMHLFLEFPPQQPTLMPLPIASTNQLSISIAPSNEFHGVKALLYVCGNELVTIKDNKLKVVDPTSFKVKTTKK